MHKLARIPLGHAEALQVGRYRSGEFYAPHYDSEPATGLFRTATVIVYLTEPVAGGETLFPKSEYCSSLDAGDEAEKDFFKCCRSLSSGITGPAALVLPPRRGQAVLFFTHDLDGRQNPGALHGSCPVGDGEKWITQQWFRSAPFPDSPQFKISVYNQVTKPEFG
eukprot:gnl/MRDRNA2_/MRDRNA2_58157_c0_seq1.p1 gnl/MRDRNA2_/MRDRNA2_58157_c0~~gnl/MRDRNA2_/MRDRNA2_58157_c0_seq1.p1  ORF type:complete len:165 (+),score=22.30 gnl/MRDRNA2_/MRDRNA2_58157_c0_seq1:96-590(+)